MAAYDAIVVGLGAMGSSTLYQLSRRGLRVLGLEAFAPGHRLGSSHGESRVIRLAYFEHPNYVPLLRRAYELWNQLERESGQDLLRITGGLMIGPPDGEYVNGARTSAVEHGLEYAMLDPAEVRYRYPVMHLSEGEVALWEPRSGYLRPERCIDTCIKLAVQNGADTRYEEPVVRWSAPRGGVEVRTDKGSYTADQLVFTCGARMSTVVGDAMPAIRPERAVLFWMEPGTPELFIEERFPIYLWDSAVYGFPHVEWPGVKVARHHTGVFCDPETVDRTVNAEDERLLRDAIADRIPALNGRVIQALTCLYENSPDGHFLIDRPDEYPNVVYAGGFSGHGFKFASVIGEIVADLVTKGQAMPEADFLKAKRLTG
jgi:sarcosine oxidase